MLPTYNNIVVATDFSPNSENAFHHAVLLARLHEAKIHLVHVISQIEPPYLSSLLGHEKQLNHMKRQYEDKAMAEIRKQLDAFATSELADFPDDLKRFDGAIALTGDPVDQILETANQMNADVLVLGTHSKGAIEHAVLGSVAEKILQKSQRPVFVVPLPG